MIIDHGWEVCVASDSVFRKFVIGMRKFPTKKPVLLFLPRGGSETLCSSFMGQLAQIGKVVCLVENPESAVALDRVHMLFANDTTTVMKNMSENVRIVIGDLETLAKTDTDCYGACVILAYGQNIPEGKSQKLTAYLYGRAQFVSRLCSRSAHVIYVEQPFTDGEVAYKDEKLTIEGMMKDKSLRKELGHIVVTRTMMGLGSHLARTGRRVTFLSSCVVGSTPSAATAYYLQIFRTSGASHKIPRPQDVPSFFLFEEAEAIKSYKDGAKTELDECLFMPSDVYKDWLAKGWSDWLTKTETKNLAGEIQ